MFDDIAQLVDETFNLSTENKIERPSDFNISHDESLEFSNLPEVTETEEISEIITKESAPSTTGIVFNLQRFTSTFVIRMVASQNIADTYQDIQESPEDYPNLRLIKNGEVDCSGLHYFECATVEGVNSIIKELNNKRFPYYEEDICNISDPGFTWWLKDNIGSFQLYFNLSQTSDMDNLIKLGPLGNKQMASQNFQDFYFFFSSLFTIKNFVATRSKVEISSTHPYDQYFSFVKSALIQGEISNELVRKMDQIGSFLNEKDREEFGIARTYITQLSYVRKFWLYINDILELN